MSGGVPTVTFTVNSSMMQVFTNYAIADSDNLEKKRKTKSILVRAGSNLVRGIVVAGEVKVGIKDALIEIDSSSMGSWLSSSSSSSIPICGGCSLDSGPYPSRILNLKHKNDRKKTYLSVARNTTLK